MTGPPGTALRHEVVAFNTATASANKIHDDAVASSLGFRGGLVPGVDVFAYLCELPAARWGAEWLAGGTISARLTTPVYDGDTVVVDAVAAADGTLTLELRDPSGTQCAAGRATRSAPQPVIDSTRWPTGPVPADPPPASAATIGAGLAGSLVAGFHTAFAVDYLDAVRSTVPLFRRDGFAHPGWLLRSSNYVLSANVRLGPWIHVASDLHLLSPVRDGDEVETRALVNRVWESKGHELVELDVLQLVGDHPVTRTTHTAIFHPRGT